MERRSGTWDHRTSRQGAIPSRTAVLWSLLVFLLGTTERASRLRGILATSWCFARNPRAPVRLEARKRVGTPRLRTPGPWWSGGSALEEDHPLFLRKIARAFAILTLAAVLALAGSAPTHAAQRSPAGIWGWLESVWREGIGGLWRVERTVPSRDAKRRAGQTKQGACVNPDGCATALTGSPGPACSRFNDQGTCVDPDG